MRLTFHAFTDARTAEDAAWAVLTDADNSRRDVHIDDIFRIETTAIADEVADGYAAVHPVAIVLSIGPGPVGDRAGRYVFHIVGTIDSVDAGPLRPTAEDRAATFAIIDEARKRS